MVDKGTLLLIVIAIAFGMLIPSNDWLAYGALGFTIFAGVFGVFKEK